MQIKMRLFFKLKWIKHTYFTRKIITNSQCLLHDIDLYIVSDVVILVRELPFRQHGQKSTGN